jgi:hypothetical protein
MKCFVANCTRKIQRVFFRLDMPSDNYHPSMARVPAKQIDIDPGRQMAVGGDLNGIQACEYLVRQLQPFGAVNVADIQRSLPPFEIAYLYSFDQPVPAKAMERVFQHNQGVLANQGKKRREEAAIAAAHVIDSEDVKVGFEQVETLDDKDSRRLEEGYDVAKTLPAIQVSEVAKRGPGRPPLPRDAEGRIIR